LWIVFIFVGRPTYPVEGHPAKTTESFAQQESPYVSDPARAAFNNAKLCSTWSVEGGVFANERRAAHGDIFRNIQGFDAGR
jgi:hypothetical protein